MKYQVGDKVLIKKDLIEGDYYGDDSYIDTMIAFAGKEVTIVNVEDGEYIIKDNEYGWTDEMIECLVGTEAVRSFDTGATRDTEEGKLDFEGFINPLVLYKYAEYMNKNRLMKDGSVRDSDNWQKGFGEKHLDVCMKSGFRHFMDWWMEHRGLESREGIDEAICGLLFNVIAYYKKILYDREGLK